MSQVKPTPAWNGPQQVKIAAHAHALVHLPYGPSYDQGWQCNICNQIHTKGKFQSYSCIGCRQSHTHTHRERGREGGRAKA